MKKNYATKILIALTFLFFQLGFSQTTTWTGASWDNGVPTITVDAIIASGTCAITVNTDDLSPEKLQEFQAAQGQLTQALGKLMVVNEAYPELKSNVNFLKLQDELAGTENRIAVERKNYNESVQAYNVKTRVFPNNIFAGLLGFKVRGTFEADAAAQKAPRVKF